jgi:citrate lyase subunit beta/citryl-CoA lyase
LGNVDLGADLGVDPGSHRALAYARSRVVLACAAAGLPAPIDGVTTAVHSDVDLSRDLARCQELGFGAKLCIHPNQVGPTNRCFTPTASQIEWARQVMASAGTGVRLVNGAMVDEPVLRRAGRIVEVTSRLEGALG